MVSNRSGWGSCWPRCSARSDCRAAGSPMHWVDLQYRKAAIGRAASDIADRAQQHCRFHSGGAHRRHAADPGEPFDFNGQRLTYPNVELVYWAGGNPFHHHQDLNRLRDAFARPDTVIVHEFGMDRDRASRRYVLPATVTLEREDIGGSPAIRCWSQCTGWSRPMPRRATITTSFLAGRAPRHCPALHRGPVGTPVAPPSLQTDPPCSAGAGPQALEFDEFWEAGELVLPTLAWDGGILRAFRRDPVARPCRRRAAGSRSHQRRS